MTACIQKLAEIDWDFSNADTRYGSHSIHPYPGKFIPQIPRALIQNIQPDRDYAVMDPFCGSGTTLLEATLAGYESIGVDSNPLACLISKVKCCPLPETTLANANDVAERAQSALSAKRSDVPDLPRLDHWFRPDIQKTLASLLEEIDKVSDPNIRDALRIAFSSIVVRVSNQESDTRYAAIEKTVTQNGVIQLFRDRVRTIVDGVASLQTNLFDSLAQPQILNSDILRVQSSSLKRRVGLVITSPPYPNAYEYWLYHKYRMYWLGMDPIAAREVEIGARPHYFKKNPHTPEDFERQMHQVLCLLDEIVIPGGHLCFLIGQSVIHGRTVDNLEFLTRAAARVGFDRVQVLTRRIARTKKSFNPANGRIDQENIAIFKRG